jgi:hypothetical protein
MKTTLVIAALLLVALAIAAGGLYAASDEVCKTQYGAKPVDPFSEEWEFGAYPEQRETGQVCTRRWPWE